MATIQDGLKPDWLNTTGLPDDDLDRFFRCWVHQACGSCMKSDTGCAWCPQSSTCVPLPAHARAPLLLPFSTSYARRPICPLGSERYELRTATLGCDCSPITLLAALLTCAGTLLAVAALAAAPAVLRWAWPRLTLRSVGYELREGEGGREGKEWVRRREGRWWQVWRRGYGGEFEIDGEDVVGGGDGDELGVGRKGWRGVWPFRLIAAAKPVRIAEGRLPRVRRHDERTRLLS